MAVIIQLRRDTATNWTTNNPILAIGEAGFETDTKKMKVGDGVNTWTNLEYYKGVATWGQITGTLNNQTDLKNALDAKQGTLTAGDNITISGSTISATDTTYTAGTGIDITNGVISNTQTSANWGNITGTLSDQTDLQNALNAKLDTTAVDGTTVNLNSSDDLQAIGLIDKNAGTAKYDWIGTLAQYEAGISGGTIPASYTCFITDDSIGEQDFRTVIVNISSGDSITLENNKIYNGGELSSLTIALPSSADNTFLSEIDFSSGTTATTLTYPNTIKWLGDDIASNVFTPVASKRYTVIFYYDGVNYVGVTKGI